MAKAYTKETLATGNPKQSFVHELTKDNVA
jgi:hypothetical protein